MRKMKYGLAGLLVGTVLILTAGSVFAAVGVENEPCQQRVPDAELAGAKATKSPLPPSPAIVEEGKAIFEGQGTCFTCHGPGGKGDGDAGKVLDPSPRNFTNPKFHTCKSDGEMFWIIKNGSPGTGMIPVINTGIITEEQAWKVIQYERSLNGK